MPRKHQEVWDRNTKYRFGIGIFLVYQIFGHRLTSLVAIVAIDSVRQIVLIDANVKFSDDCAHA